MLATRRGRSKDVVTSRFWRSPGTGVENEAMSAVLPISDARARALIEYCVDGILLVDSVGIIIYASPSTERLLGFTPEDQQGRSCLDLVHPDDLAPVQEWLLSLITSDNGTVTTEYRLRHKDGAWRWIQGIGNNLLHEPAIAGVVLNFRDITAGHEAADQIRTSRDQLATILASVSDGIMVQDENGKLIYVNDAGAQMCGMPSAEAMLTRPVFEIVSQFSLVDEHGEPLSLNQLPARQVMAGAARAELLIGAHNMETGEDRWSLVTAAPAHDWQSGTTNVVSVFRDVTARRRLEEAQQEAIQVRDRFLSTASHELRTPLTTLKAQLQLSQRRLQRDASREAVLEGLRLAERQASRLNHLIGDLLDVSRLTSGQMPLEPVLLLLPDLIQRIIEAEQMLEPEREIICIVPDAGLWVLADEIRLEQVVVNLLQNARKYSPQGSRITVTVSGDADMVRVAVRDEGIGIPNEDQARIFAPFQRAANIEHGTPGLGLGLSIAYDLVRAHDGELAVDSAPGAGSTFTLSLPRAAPPPHSGGSESQMQPGA